MWLHRGSRCILCGPGGCVILPYDCAPVPASRPRRRATRCLRVPPQVLNPHTLEVTDTISLRTKAAGAAWPSVVTSVRFRPPQASSGMQNVLLVTAVRKHVQGRVQVRAP